MQGVFSGTDVANIAVLLLCWVVVGWRSALVCRSAVQGVPVLHQQYFLFRRLCCYFLNAENICMLMYSSSQNCFLKTIISFLSYMVIKHTCFQELQGIRKYLEISG